MRVNPHGRKSTLRGGKQRTCRPQLDALYSRPHFHHMGAPRPGLALAGSLDTTVTSTRADVAAATVPTST